MKQFLAVWSSWTTGLTVGAVSATLGLAIPAIALSFWGIKRAGELQSPPLLVGAAMILIGTLGRVAVR